MVSQMERIPADLEFKPDSPLSWSQQVGTAILQLMESQAVSHVTWLIEVSLPRSCFIATSPLKVYLSATRRDLGHAAASDLEYRWRAQGI